MEIRGWSEVEQAIVRTSWVQQLLIGLREMAITRRGQVWGTRHTRGVIRTRGGPVGRGDKEEVSALVFDEEGKLVLDPGGNPCAVPFTVLRACIDPKRGLLVELSTTHDTDPVQGKPFTTVQVSLQHGSRRLTFSPEQLQPDERGVPQSKRFAALRVELGVRIDLPRLPVEALRLTVHPS
jgi:hypothetical protein